MTTKYEKLLITFYNFGASSTFDEGQGPKLPQTKEEEREEEEDIDCGAQLSSDDIEQFLQ